MESAIVLKVKQRENQTAYIDPCQTDDGTMFYHDRLTKGREILYVKWQGKEVDTKLPPDTYYSSLSVHGNAIYFSDKKKIYKAVFTPPNIEYEEVMGYGFLSRIINTKKYVYRIYDNPDKDKILVDASDEQLKRMTLKLVHRKKAYYCVTTPESSVPQLCKLTDNIIVVKANKVFSLYSKDNSAIIYCSHNSDCIFVFNSETLIFLPPIRIENVSIWDIAGVNDGVITVRGWINNVCHLVTAQLPSGYFDDTLGVRGETIREVVEQGVKEVQPIVKANEFRSRFINEFLITKVMGFGAFGIVFEARNNIDKQIYAVKRIPVDSDKKVEACREVEVMAKLDHPGIVRYNSTWMENPPKNWQVECDISILKKIGSLGELPKIQYGDMFIYIQMQKCDQSLAQWITNNRQTSTRSISRIKSWSRQILSAIAYIHNKELIHRDLKPQNILIADSGRPKVCDLGIVTDRRVGGAEVTEDYRTSIGTRLYMSPEQLSWNSKYSSKTDVFSIGLILAELSIVMTPAQRFEIFDNYRRGKQCKLVRDSETAKVVEMLTRVDPNNRPTCKEMLEHPYFKR